MQQFMFVIISVNMHVIIRVSYLQSLYSIVVHGYVVHSVLASYVAILMIMHVVCT